jgi:hypothetical protein
LSLTELFVAAGIFSAGFLVFTLMIKVAVPIMLGRFTANERLSEPPSSPASVAS